MEGVPSWRREVPILYYPLKEKKKTASLDKEGATNRRQDDPKKKMSRGKGRILS